MRAKVFSLLGAVLLGVLLAMAPVASASGAASTVVGVQPVADPTPSPTLGSTESPNPNPPGAQDADPDDYTGATWIVIGAAVIVVLVAGGSFVVFRNRRRTPAA
jgi:hypothetical protein